MLHDTVTKYKQKKKIEKKRKTGKYSESFRRIVPARMTNYELEVEEEGRNLRECEGRSSEIKYLPCVLVYVYAHCEQDRRS